MSLRSTSNGSVHGLVYSLVPAQPLPAVDLSKSFRGRLLPGFIHHTYIRRRYSRYYRQILLCATVSYCSGFLVPLVPASTGRVFAFLAFFLWMPSGFGSVTTLRYDIVRLVCRTFDFWFFSTITSVIVVTISMYFSDLRWLRMIIEWLRLHHVIFIDAHVLGLRSLIYILIFGMISLVTVLVWIMLGRVDGGSTFTVVKYGNEHGGFELSGLDVIGNGLASLALLLAKIIFRRRKTLRVRRKRSSSLVEYNSALDVCQLLVSWVSLLCTLTFTVSFAVFYQRQLLRLLFSSFDFMFYSFQVTSSYICVCSLYDWELPQCLMALSWWLWAHWIFTLDALTPTMRSMLKFRVRYAAPVLCLLLIDHVGLVYQIFLVGDTTR
ncbi:hypothetical protein PHYSODRAFT_468573 [Phytophthora sojae]|uniref:Uncharacterized protein n=1 Tax=Phytophthora sojae (strain P6497) TaxID=1094619 RepID=G4YJL1_PHYSP|nr:hypothetical protein PHYSODRAFT_468573 [Phytophthora sojae]EGZ29966.1 hypothetical protein PHYSODRAFT_468573 [Phytophthora sojae]|eukprot:XP_009517241.1 hypothetical protein PHYSODRAFT_468573 [Phytophthora sojae]